MTLEPPGPPPAPFGAPGPPDPAAPEARTSSKRILAVVLGFAMIGGVVGGVFLVGSRDTEPDFDDAALPAGWSQHSPAGEGFSIGLPPAWRALPAGEVDDAMAALRRDNQELADLVQSQIAGSFSDLVRFFAVDTEAPTLTEDFVTNVNVVVEPVPENVSFDGYLAANLTQLRRLPGVTVSEQNQDLALSGGRAARIRSTFTLNSPSGPRRIAVTQYLTLIGRRGYILSMTTTPAHDATYRSLFDRIARTFRPG